MNDKDFILYIRKYIPTQCRADEGTNFNLQQVHMMINSHLGEQ